MRPSTSPPDEFLAPLQATVVLRQSPNPYPTPISLTDTPSPRMPHRLGEYEIRKELGRGGMGVVYEAFDPNLRRTVAVKVLLNTRDDDYLKRFQTEAEAAAQLQHPFIVQVYDVGVHDGVPFVALEFMPGGTLHQKIAGKPQDPKVAAAWIRDLASAAAHAHDHGVLHRDLKPANVLLTVDGQLKITDFGAARWLAQDGEHQDPGLTRAGEVIGTPQYMPPEQAGGSQDEVGPAADVYSLGAILYELLTGRPPFTGVDPYDVIHSVRTQDPVAPRRIRPSIPRDLETICLKCLDKNPLRRYESARALLGDLNRFLNGDAIHARPPRLLRRLWITAKRRPAAAGLIAGLIVAGVIGISAFAWQFSKTIAALDAAKANEITARRERQNAIESQSEVERQKAEAVANLNKSESNLYRSKILQSSLTAKQGDLTTAMQILGEAPELLRGWEWYYLLQETADLIWARNAMSLNPGFKDTWVDLITLSPDGSRVAVSYFDPFFHGPVSYEAPSHLAIYSSSDGAVISMKANITKSRIAKLVWMNERELLVSDFLNGITVFDSHSLKPVANWPTDKKNGQISNVNNTGTVALRMISEPSSQMEVIDPRRIQPTRTIPLRSPKTYPKGISDDGRWACLQEISADQVVSMLIIDLRNGRIRCEFPNAACPVVFSHNGRYAVSALGHENDSKPYLWRNASDQPWQRLRSIPGQKPTCTVTVWDTETWTPVWTKWHYASTYGIIHFAPDDSRFVVYNDDTYDIHCYGTETGLENVVFRGHTAVVHDIRFSPDGQLMISGSDDRTIRIWDIMTGAQILINSNHNHCVRQAMFSHDGRQIISGGADHAVICSDLSKPVGQGGIMPPLKLTYDGTVMGTIGFTAEGSLLTLDTHSGFAEVDCASGNIIRRQKATGLEIRNQKEISDFCFSADARRVSGRARLWDQKHSTYGTHVAVWEYPSGRLVNRFVNPYDQLMTTGLSPDGKLVLASAVSRKTKTPTFHLLAWDVDRGDLRFDLPLDQPVVSLAFRPDGQEFAAGFNRSLKVNGPAVVRYNIEGEGIEKIEVEAVEDPYIHRLAYVNSLRYSADGSLLGFFTWTDQLLRVHDVKEKKTKWAKGVNSPMTSLDFTPDAKRVAMIGYHDTIHIFDVESGQEVSTISCTTGRVDDFAFPAQIRFSPDGKSLAATHWQGQLSVRYVDNFTPEGMSGTRIRELANQSAFRFHLHSAQLAIGRNDSYAFGIQKDWLGKNSAPTAALREDWDRIRETIQPQKMAVAVVGGIATPVPREPTNVSDSPLWNITTTLLTRSWEFLKN